ncbi:hypothetical protein B0H19DRAFT_1082320 [Mycena capillaripes]|nr:hypothetical protein B0H19DRAFT_1082320 [Mycena capillaripes]
MNSESSVKIIGEAKLAGCTSSPWSVEIKGQRWKFRVQSYVARLEEVNVGRRSGLSTRKGSRERGGRKRRDRQKRDGTRRNTDPMREGNHAAQRKRWARMPNRCREMNEEGSKDVLKRNTHAAHLSTITAIASLISLYAFGIMPTPNRDGDCGCEDGPGRNNDRLRLYVERG